MTGLAALTREPLAGQVVKTGLFGWRFWIELGSFLVFCVYSSRLFFTFDHYTDHKRQCILCFKRMETTRF